MKHVRQVFALCVLAGSFYFGGLMLLNQVEADHGEIYHSYERAHNTQEIEKIIMEEGVNNVRTDFFQHGQETGKLAIQYCDGKVNVGMTAVARRDTGVSEKDSLAILQAGNANLKKNNNIIPRHVYLEYERMLRTAYRHPKSTKVELYDRFYKECLAMGY